MVVVCVCACVCVYVCFSRYMFVKLGLHDPVEASRILRAVHNWLPLFLFFSILLSRVCTAHRSFLLTVTQVRGQVSPRGLMGKVAYCYLCSYISCFGSS